MEPVLTPEQARTADAATIAAGNPGPALMQRAAWVVAQQTLARLGSAYGKRVTVLCGVGNNGGDGRIAAVLLARRGVRCDVIDIATAGEEELLRSLRRADAVIDAMFGTGFRGALDGLAARAADETARRSLPVVAIDIPSGIDGATGLAGGSYVRASTTVTMQALKRGLLYAAGRVASGEVVVADLGIDLAPAHPTTHRIDSRDIAAWLPPRSVETNKWVAAVYVVAGSAGMTGAPMLVAQAAMRSGAGMVWCGMPGDAARNAGGTEVITKALPSTPDGAAIDVAAVELVLADLKRFGALVLGPGLGGEAPTVRMIGQLVAEAPVPLVLDADGLNAIAGDFAPLRIRAEQLHAATVLTPHDGEYARLMGHAPHADRVASAQALAEATSSVVLLKGSTTTVAAPDGRAYIVTAGGPELASAGTGDALSGIIGAFLARGIAPLEAAAAAAYVHGGAGARVGPGLVASDLLAAIPPTLVALTETGV